MTINGVSGIGMQPGTTGIGAGAGAQTDAVSKDLQHQIENLQKQMQELSSNNEMPAETKMKKRQEMQKQISDLEVQLRQHQMEVKRQAAMKKREKSNGMDEMLGTKQQEKQSSSQSTGMSAGSMEALLSADASMKQAGVHGSTARKMEGKAAVLEVEIQLDSSRGGSTDLKREQLAEVKEIAQQATASQMESLAEANKTMQDASKDERKDEDDKSEETTGKATEGAQNIGTDKTQGEEGVTAETQVTETRDGNQNGAAGQNTFDVQIPGVAFSRGYTPVDVKL
ncbi:MAG: FlxA-like family protein [Lachnospiraceae bacterium]|nr:FlxA-like family protein [Lachnospiraceae bacterium]